MASIEAMIPHILTWEVSVNDTVRKKRDAMIKAGASGRELYALVSPYGYHCIKNDSGGHTMCGVTLTTYTEWRYYNGKPKPTVAELKTLQYDEWLAILKHFFWDRCKADKITNSSIALMMVDWCWLNGATTAIRQMQSAFGLVTDGIIGPKSLAALNAAPASVTFERLKTARERSYDKIVAARPSQKVFYNGWMNRTNSIEYKA